MSVISEVINNPDNQEWLKHSGHPFILFSTVPCWGGINHIDLTTKPKRKTLSVSGVEYNHNFNQPLPEIIGERFDLNDLNIEGYKAGDCTCKSPKLEWNHFIRVQKFNETRHPKTNVLCVTVLAWTQNNYKAPVLLICKYKNK